MADYTMAILLTLALCFNYLLVYKKNRPIADILFLAIGIGSMYISYEYIIIFSYAIMVIAIISFVYDVFVKPQKTTGQQY